MAGAASNHTRGEMDITEQSATFNLVMGMTKWGSLAVATLVTFLVLWFCVGAGFIGAAATAVVMIALGVFFLRAKPEAAAAH